MDEFIAWALAKGATVQIINDQQLNVSLSSFVVGVSAHVMQDGGQWAVTCRTSHFDALQARETAATPREALANALLVLVEGAIDLQNRWEQRAEGLAVLAERCGNG
jgi:hypothetical protein